MITILNNKINNIRCSMEKFAKFKHEYVDYLYNGHIYWRSERKIFDE